MIKVIINEEFENETSMIDGLNYIIGLIEQGNTSGYYPTWEIQTVPDEETKNTKILRIKEIIMEWGETTSTELELDCSPCISSHSSGGRNTSVLVEGFNEDDVNVITYIDETEINNEDIEYDELSEDIIDEILGVMENYNTDMEKTMKRCED